MELVFADDSGKDATRHNYLIEAAVAFNEAFLPQLEDHIVALKARFGIPAGSELHWGTRKYKDPDNPAIERQLSAAEQRELRMAFLEFLGLSNATVILTGVQHGRRLLSTSVCWCLDFIAERVQRHLEEMAPVGGPKVLGLLIIDEPGEEKKENRKVREHLAQLHRDGTGYVSRFDTLVMNSIVYPSHLVPGIQLADFVAGAFDRFLNRGEEEWWVVLGPNVRRGPGPARRFLGYGLKLWPSVTLVRIGATEIR